MSTESDQTATVYIIKVFVVCIILYFVRAIQRLRNKLCRFLAECGELSVKHIAFSRPAICVLNPACSDMPKLFLIFNRSFQSRQQIARVHITEVVSTYCIEVRALKLQLPSLETIDSSGSSENKNNKKYFKYFFSSYYTAYYDYVNSYQQSAKRNVCLTVYAPHYQKKLHSSLSPQSLDGARKKLGVNALYVIQYYCMSRVHRCVLGIVLTD